MAVSTLPNPYAPMDASKVVHAVTSSRPPTVVARGAFARALAGYDLHAGIARGWRFLPPGRAIFGWCVYLMAAFRSLQPHRRDRKR